MKKILLTLCMVLSLTACDEKKATKQSMSKPVIKIGAILPLSGDLAVWGNSEKQGLFLAQENLPYNTKFQYKFIIEDSANSNKNIQHIAQKLISVDKVQAIITMFDPAANIVAPLASANKVLHFGQSWFPQYVGDKYNYNVYADINDEAQLIADYLQNKGIKKVYFFTVNQTGFIGGTEILKNILDKKDISYQETFFNFGQRDFMTDIIKAKDFKAEAYVLGAFAPEVDILAKQLKQVNGDDVLITGLDLGLNVANRGLYANQVFAVPALPQADFIQKYQARFGDENYLFGAVVGFISFNAIVAGFEKTKKDDVSLVADFVFKNNKVASVFADGIKKEGGKIYLPSELLTVIENKLIAFEE